jgi:hypothetical protein
MGPPPRPPRRIQIGIPEAMSPPPPVSAHSASHSMSSLHMLSPSTQRISLEEQTPQAMGAAGVSRTQSLRNQAKHSRNASLGRSSSLRDAAEVRHSSLSSRGWELMPCSTLDTVISLRLHSRFTRTALQMLLLPLRRLLFPLSSSEPVRPI